VTDSSVFYSSESKSTFEKVLCDFEVIEKELALDQSVIEGVPWWDMLRYPIFQGILQDLDLLEKPKQNGKQQILKDKISRSYKILFDIFGVFSPRSPLWVKKNSILIWGHPRRKYQDECYIDLYVDPFIDFLPHSSKYAVLEKAEAHGHLKPVATKNLYYLDIIQSMARIFYSIRRNTKKLDGDFGKVEELERKLKQVFDIDLNVKNQVNTAILHWKSIYPLMYRFFKLKQPSHFFIVVSAAHEAIISAAKAARVPTYELQHGSPARGKLNYDYSSGLIKKSFPDYFLSFGEYWSSAAVLPLPRQRVIPFGYPYLTKKVIEYSNLSLQKDQLLIVSQSVHARALAKLAIAIIQIHTSKIKVVFKPHPAELYHGEPDYFKSLRLAGVTIPDENADLYLLFAQSAWQVGVYSTALYEGLCFGAACFLVRLPGFEQMKPLVDIGLARLIDDHHDIDLDWSVDPEAAQKLFAQPSREKVEKLLSYSQLDVH
jgi:hypothetical protein